VTPSDCQQIDNIAVGRTQDLLRIFVTCKQEKTGNTIIRFFDRTYDVYFDQVDFLLKIEAGSQPFFADFNGDFLDDILFSDGAQL
jgi:hypothetical protein